jgi:hypothetical protein
MNLKRWLSYSTQNQTPYTPSMSLYLDFLQKIESFNLKHIRDKINYVSDNLVKIFGEDNIIGEKYGPCITLKDKNIIKKEVRDKYTLYGSQSSEANSKIQIFTYSENIEDYEKLFQELQ